MASAPQGDAARHEPDKSSKRRATEPSSRATIATVGTFRASLEDTIHNVNYHLNVGIDHLFLFFDDPSDRAFEVLADYPGVTCFRCDDRHWESNGFALPLNTDVKQIVNANIAFRLAKEMGIDWIAHIDSDELIYSEEDVGWLLGGTPEDVDVVDFRVMEAVPEALEYDNMFASVSLFRTIPRRGSPGRLLLAELLGCRSAFFNGEYFRGHDRKTAVRVNSKIERLSIHAPAKDEAQDYKQMRSNDLALLHYDGCGLEYWSAKWSSRRDGVTVFPGLRPNRTQQQDKIFRAIGAGGERLVEAYREMQFIGDRQKVILSGLGLLQRIVIDRRLFSAPRTPRGVDT